MCSVRASRLPKHEKSPQPMSSMSTRMMLGGAATGAAEPAVTRSIKAAAASNRRGIGRSLEGDGCSLPWSFRRFAQYYFIRRSDALRSKPPVSLRARPEDISCVDSHHSAQASKGVLAAEAETSARATATTDTLERRW